MDIGDEITESIERFNSRKKFPVLTERIIETIADDELEQAVMDCIDFKIDGNYEDSYEIISLLSSGFRMVYSTWYLEAEINNGGFNQFFWNCGEFAEEALEGLRVLGTEEHARLMQKAIEIFIEEEPRQRRFYIENSLEAFSESYKHTKLNALDDEFYKLSELSLRRIRYIREHMDQFTENTALERLRAT